MSPGEVRAWRVAGESSLSAAQALHAGDHCRSAVSRAYYAAYAMLTCCLLGSGREVGDRGRPNPSHARLVQLVGSNLPPDRFSEPDRRQLARLARRLYAARLAADYDPTSHVDAALSLACVRHASTIAQHTEGV